MKKILIILILILSVFSVANAHPFKSEKELQDFYAKIDKEVDKELKKDYIKLFEQRKANLKEKATAIFWNINYFFIFSIIYKTIRSIGSENLSLIISNLQLQEESKTPVISIIKHGVNIFYRGNIIPEDINNDFKTYNFSEIAKLVMKQIITLYSQFHIIDYKDKQRISDILKIKIKFRR